MKSIITLVILLFISGLTFGQNNQADTTKKKDQKNNVSPQQVHITPDASGVKRSIGYKFSSASGDGDPGNGMFRLDNRNVQEARYIIIDDKDNSGNDQTKWYSTWDDPTGATGRGRATLADISGKVICVFNFTGVFTDAEGFWRLPVQYVSGSSLIDGVVYYYLFDRIANRNDPDKTNSPRAKEPVEKTNVEAAVVTGAGIVAVTEVSQATQVVQVNQGNEVKEVKEEKQEQQQVTQVAEQKEVKEEKQEQHQVVQVTEQKEVKEEKQEQQQVAQVTEQKEVKEEKQVSQAVVTAVAATEAAVVVQANNQVQVTVAEPPVQITDSVKVKQTTQVSQAVVVPVVAIEAAAVTEVSQVTQVAQAAQVAEQKEVKEEKQEQQQVAQVSEQKEVKEEKQVSQAVVAAVVTTETAAITQTNNQVQAVVAEPVVPKKDTIAVKPTTQGNQAAVSTTAAVTTGAIAATQAANPPRVAQVNTQGTTQAAQSKPVTQTTAPAQTKPVTQTAPPAQTKPVTQTTPPAQTKPVTQAAVTTTAATTVAVQSVPKTQTTQTTQQTQATQATQKTQTTQPTQQIQSNQATQPTQPTQPNNQPPAKQYNQFPVVQNIFASGGSGSGHRRWYRGIIEVGYGFGLGDYGINNFRFNFINAIRIGDFSSIGLGIGYRRYFTKNDAAPYLVSNVDQIPFFLDLRTSFSTRKLTPYAALGIGASRGFRSAGTDEGLLMLNGSGGIWYNVSSRFAVFAGIAYEMQKLRYSDTDPFADSYLKNAGSISLNIGISF